MIATTKLTMPNTVAKLRATRLASSMASDLALVKLVFRAFRRATDSSTRSRRARKGLVLRIGEVLLEVSEPCDPCTEVYVLPYVGKEKGPAFVRTLTGRRGWFARVLSSGEVVPGAVVEVTPA